MTSPEPLAAHHQLVGFDCGVPDLNQWLQRRALANQQGGASRTWVLSEGGVVIAFNSLAPGSIVLGEVPGALRRNMPNPLPVVALGRLAVDRRHQGEGLGRALVAHAVARSLEAQQLIGVRALLVHALDDQAVALLPAAGLSSLTHQPDGAVAPALAVALTRAAASVAGAAEEKRGSEGGSRAGPWWRRRGCGPCDRCEHCWRFQPPGFLRPG